MLYLGKKYAPRCSTEISDVLKNLKDTKNDTSIDLHDMPIFRQINIADESILSKDVKSLDNRFTQVKYVRT